MNDSSRYVIILHGLKAKDFKKINEVMLQAIRDTLREENIRAEVIEEFVSRAKEFTFTSTKDRTSVARLNKACDHAYFYERFLDTETLSQPAVSKDASRFIVGKGKNEYIRPNEALYRDLEEWIGEAIFQKDAVVLHVRLELENHEVWRRIAVPKQITFPELHEALLCKVGTLDVEGRERFELNRKKPQLTTGTDRDW
jgi:hypothetical protein